MKIQGVVQEIWAAKSSKGKSYQGIRLEEHESAIFCWKPELLKGITEGMAIEIDATEGEFPRLQKVKTIGKTQEQEKIPHTNNSREQSINRAVALKAAVEFYKLQKIEINGKRTYLAGICKMADELLEWLEAK